MKRYAITPIVPPEGEDGYRSSAFDVVATSANSVIPVDGQTGIPLYGFTFCRIGRVDFGPILQLSNSYIFPDYPLDGAISGMESGVLTALKQSCEAFDLDGNGLNLSIDISDTAISYEALLLAIYQQFDAGLNLLAFRRFDVSEAT